MQKSNRENAALPEHGFSAACSRMHGITLVPTLVTTLALILVLGAASQSAIAQEEDEPELVVNDELRVETFESVPPMIMSAARGAAPDVVFQSVESVWMDDRRVYRFSGRLYREVWRVDVADTGRVLRVKRDNQDD